MRGVLGNSTIFRTLWSW